MHDAPTPTTTVPLKDGEHKTYTSASQANQAIEYTIQRSESILDNVCVLLADGQPCADSDIPAK